MTVDHTAYRNLGEALAARVAEHPERVALTFIHGAATPGATAQTLTFAELAERAERRARALRSRLALGERVLIALPTCAEFVELYVACLISGLVAVPTPPPGGAAATVDRVAAIAVDCAPGIAVTTGSDREALQEQLHARGLHGVEVADAADLTDGPAFVPDEVDREMLAVLQYSSGSTGTPRGVELSHGNILADMFAVAAGTGFGPDDVMGIWNPLHHDMGLFGQCTAALLFGMSAVLMRPQDFVRRPVSWLRMLHDYHVTVSAGPNFAYDMCIRLIPDRQLEELDLSRLRLLFNGAEPIHVPTMAAFNKRFAAFGLSPAVLTPAYGLAEATIYVCSTDPDAEPTVLVADRERLSRADRPELAATSGAGQEITGVGRAGEIAVRIVDPETSQVLPDGAIGEIWLRGPALTRGYWGRPELSVQTCRARLASAADKTDRQSDWVRSGDLGALLDGELFVTGRIKELIILRGRNIAPQDVEQAARAAHPALAGCIGAAFGVEAPDERIVLVQEVDPRTPSDQLGEISSELTKALTADLGVPVRNVLLARRGTVRRTTSGKIRRVSMRELFLAGEVKALHTQLDTELRRTAAGGER